MLTDRQLCVCIAAKMRANKPAADVNVLGLVRGNEHYFFMYLDTQRADAMECIGQFAGHLELSFNWFDAAVLNQKIRREEREGRNHVNRLEQV